MSIEQDASVVEAQMFPQGDSRDPLGVWGVRHGVTGDATGGTIKVFYEVTSPKRAAFVYTCYALTFVQLTGTVDSARVKVRLLTGWPNVDPSTGVQAFATARFVNIFGNTGHTAPIAGPEEALVSPEQRFLLLFDPRPSGADLVIAELEWRVNQNLATYVFEGYGYYWDRAVMNAPGGPRHPGSH